MLAGIEVIRVIVEHHIDDREAKQRRAADICLLLHRIHRYFDGDSDKLLYLFRTASRPLGNDCHLRIRHIGKGIDRRMDKAHCSRYHGYGGTEKDKEFILQRESYYVIYKCMHRSSFTLKRYKPKEHSGR